MVHRSFQLDPNFPLDVTRSVRSMLRERYEMPEDQIEEELIVILRKSLQAEGLEPIYRARKRSWATQPSLTSFLLLLPIETSG